MSHRDGATLLIVNGGTAEQRVAAQTLWDTATFPRGFLDGHQVKLTFMPDMTGGQTARGGHIVLSDELSTTDLGFVMLHEIGHLADFWCLDDADRQQVLDAQRFSEWDFLAVEGWCNGFATTYQPPGSGYPQYPLDNDLVRELMDACGQEAMEDEPMASSAQKRIWWKDWECDTTTYQRVAFPGVGRVWNLWVADAAVPIWERFITVMNTHDYQFRESAGGTYNCRNIGGTNKRSLHSYGIALDLNPSVNPFGAPLRHDYPAAFITDVEAITTNGKPAFRWGGRWTKPDAMHWEVDVPPEDIGDDDMATLSEEAQQFYEDNYRKALEVLTPSPGGMTNEDMTHTLVNHVRNHPGGGGGLTEMDADTRYVRKGAPVVIKGTS